MNVLKEFHEFESQEYITGTQKTQLELYLDESRIDVNINLHIFSFGKQIRFDILILRAWLDESRKAGEASHDPRSVD